jgi:hypothetical protein
VYKPANATYASLLLDHAERLFAFADKHRGSYTRTFPELSAYYNSTTYKDELLWAASWLYHATGNQSYLSYATGKNADEFANLRNPRYFSWDDKRAGTEVGINLQLALQMFILILNLLNEGGKNTASDTLSSPSLFNAGSLQSNTRSKALPSPRSRAAIKSARCPLGTA